MTPEAFASLLLFICVGAGALAGGAVGALIGLAVTVVITAVVP